MEKQVNFEMCKTCKHWEKSESEDPCWDCLDEFTNEDSNTPVYYIPADDKSQ